MKTILLSLSLLTAGLLNAQDRKAPAQLDIRTSSVCDMCEKTIETEMLYEKGVKAVDLDLVSGIVRIDYDPKRTDPDKLRKALTGLGYSADDIPADPEAFKDLPACCQKEGCGQLK